MNDATPIRRRVPCALGCGTIIDTDATTTYQYVTGWARNRSQGGTNALALRCTEPRYACRQCIDRQTVGGWSQPELFERQS